MILSSCQLAGTPAGSRIFVTCLSPRYDLTLSAKFAHGALFERHLGDWDWGQAAFVGHKQFFGLGGSEARFRLKQSLLFTAQPVD